MTTRRPIVIDSPANPRIRSTARLRDRRERDATGLTLVDGAREVRRALDASVEVVEAFACEPMLAGADARDAFDRLRAGAFATHPTSPGAFAKVAFGDRSDGLVAVIRWPTRRLSDIDLPDDALVVVLDGLEKPGNVGAILRTADGAGADLVIAADAGTDLANPNVIRASAGTIFSVPAVAADATDVRTWLTDRGIRVVAARVDGGTGYTEADLTGSVALVVGNEATGLGSVWAGPDVVVVRVPMLGVADSLNVSVTTAILLYEARRQRDARRNGGD